MASEMPLSCDALIFDLDGVLIDSRAVVERYWRRWADEHDIPFEEIEGRYHGRPSAEVIREVAPHLDAAEEAQKRREQRSADTEGLEAFRGARDLLAALPSDRWTIATSGTYHTATSRLSHVGLPEPDTLVTADDVEQGKPAPEPYRLAAQRLNVAPEQALVLEDAPVGVTSARQAGARVVGVSATTPVDDLSDADAVIPGIHALQIEPGPNGSLRVHLAEVETR